MPEVFFNGPAGRIEGKYQHNSRKDAPVALVLHPHPLHGGTMNNKVAYNMYRNFAECGFSVLRFNFRGVGRSEGEFDKGEGELYDAATALDWLQINNPDASTFWVAGFSFGAWIAMQLLMRRPELETFIAIAPPAGMYNFDFLAPCPRSGLILQGNSDNIVQEANARNLASRLDSQRGIDVQYQMVEGADHFFKERMDEMNDAMKLYIRTNVAFMVKRGQIRPDRKRRRSS